MPQLSRSLKVALLGLATALSVLAAPGHAQQPASLPELGLMGTIPIFWGETGELSELISGAGETHWARARLEAGYTLRPLDSLSDESLERLEFLLLAQPRALSPAENVALDAWVRAGGRLLLFADPMLTSESRFAVGDRRRPQDVILLSPILRHWGLELEFDIDRPAGFAEVMTAGVRIPVNRPGRFVEVSDESACALAADNVLARCAVGAGRALVLADAALLDLRHAHPAAGGALDWLVEQGFRGEIAGPTRFSGRDE
jgi:hypothetical protein